MDSLSVFAGARRTAGPPVRWSTCPPLAPTDAMRAVVAPIDRGANGIPINRCGYADARMRGVPALGVSGGVRLGRSGQGPACRSTRASWRTGPGRPEVCQAPAAPAGCGRPPGLRRRVVSGLAQDIATVDVKHESVVGSRASHCRSRNLIRLRRCSGSTRRRCSCVGAAGRAGRRSGAGRSVCVATAGERGGGGHPACKQCINIHTKM